MFRALARPLLASWFIYDGVQHALEPAVRAQAVTPLLEQGMEATGVHVEAQTVVRAHGVLQAVSATILATSKTPRLAGSALALLAGASLATRPAFWRMPQGAERDRATGEFLVGLSLLGGALLASSAGHGAMYTRHKSRTKAKAKQRKAAAKAKEQAALARALEKAERRFW